GARIIRGLMASRPEHRSQARAELPTILEVGLSTGNWPEENSAAITMRVPRPNTGVLLGQPNAFAAAAPAKQPVVSALRWAGFVGSGSLTATTSGSRWLWKKGKEWPRVRQGVLGGLLGLCLLFVLWLILRETRTPLGRLKPSKVSADERALAGQLEGLVAVLGD